MFCKVALEFNLVNQMLFIQVLCQHEVLTTFRGLCCFYMLPSKIFFTDAALTSEKMGSSLVSWRVFFCLWPLLLLFSWSLCVWFLPTVGKIQLWNKIAKIILLPIRVSAPFVQFLHISWCLHVWTALLMKCWLQCDSCCSGHRFLLSYSNCSGY